MTIRSVGEVRVSHERSALSGAVAAVLFGGMGVVAIGAAIAEAVTGHDGPIAVVALVGIAMLLVAAFMARDGLSARERARSLGRIEARGIAAWATLTGFEHGRQRSRRQRIYRIGLTVTLPDRPPYAAEARWFVPTALRQTLAPGARLCVLVDPEDTNSVIVDWDRTQAAWAQGVR
jgi:hypothetical protein